MLNLSIDSTFACINNNLSVPEICTDIFFPRRQYLFREVFAEQRMTKHKYPEYIFEANWMPFIVIVSYILSHGAAQLVFFVVVVVVFFF